MRSFDGASYEIEASSFGMLRLDAQSYDCVGDGCRPTGPAPAAPATPRSGIATLSFEPRQIQRAEDFADRRLGRRRPVDHADARPRIRREHLGRLLRQLVGANPRQHRYRVSDGRGDGSATIELRRSDSTAALDALICGRAAIAVSTRPATPQETRALELAVPRELAGPIEHVIGLDGLVVLVSPDNPATSIAVADVARIFSGRVTMVLALGQAARRIQLYASTERAGATDRLAQILMNQARLALPPGTI